MWEPMSHHGGVTVPPTFSLPGNLALWCVGLGWVLAQFSKFVATWIQERRVDFAYFVSTGGMPSAHSASVSSLAFSVGFSDGFSSTLFAVAMVMAMIVMFDAQSVRRAAGHQATLLNQIISDFFKDHYLPHGKLKELLGHTPIEVFAGFFLGAMTAFTLHVFAGGMVF